MLRRSPMTTILRDLPVRVWLQRSLAFIDSTHTRFPCKYRQCSDLALNLVYHNMKRCTSRLGAQAPLRDRVAPDLELDTASYRTYSPTTPPPFAAKGQANDVFSRQLYCLYLNGSSLLSLLSLQSAYAVSI
jgi:hypothetical protein